MHASMQRHPISRIPYPMHYMHTCMHMCSYASHITYPCNVMSQTSLQPTGRYNCSYSWTPSSNWTTTFDQGMNHTDCLCAAAIPTGMHNCSYSWTSPGNITTTCDPGWNLTNRLCAAASPTGRYNCSYRRTSSSNCTTTRDPRVNHKNRLCAAAAPTDMYNCKDS